MEMILTKSQNRVVNDLFSLYKKRNLNKESFLKAPTGSGKTLMASSLISKILEDSVANGIKTMVVVATISNAELPKQLTKKFEIYRKSHDYRNYEIELITSPSNSKSAKVEYISEFEIKENNVFVFGLSSFGRNTLFYENRTLDIFLESSKALGYEIVFIRDEAHVGEAPKINKVDKERFDSKMNDAASFIMKMTATPTNKESMVELKISEMEEDGRKLLKTNMKKTDLVGEVTNSEIIDDAIKTFLKTKKEYQKISEDIINPAMLIQLSNESSVDKIKQEQFEEGLDLLETKLKTAGLKYLKYFGHENKAVFGTNVPPTLEYASKNNSILDVIIFKVGPATGWDIPRANMLLQLRNVSSEKLNIQTLGRIMRNPLPSLEENDIACTYYLYSNYQKPSREDAIYSLEEKFKQKKLLYGYVNKESEQLTQDTTKFKESLIDLFMSSDFKNKVKDISEGEVIYGESSYGNAKVLNKIPNYFYLKLHNIQNAKEHINLFDLSDLDNVLNDVSVETKTNLEIVKYCVWFYINDIQKIKRESMVWFEKNDVYEISESENLKQYYQIWKDNENPKQADTSTFDNYGYKLIEDNEHLQYLDSEPELKFFEKFNDSLSAKQKSEIKFFAKMPTLGSKIYFEYYSSLDAGIKKSYMDFAIEYKEKVIMVEVKSFDNDYDEEKTKDLLRAYKKYMDKFGDEKLSLILFQWDKEHKKPVLNSYIEGEWKENISIRDVFDYLYID